MMNTKANVTKLALTLTATAGLLGSSLQASASDNRLWREQVPTTQTVEAGRAHIHSANNESGSWFIREIVNNQLGHGAEQETEQSYAASLSVEAEGNWFLSTVSPASYRKDS